MVSPVSDSSDGERVDNPVVEISVGVPHEGAKACRSLWEMISFADPCARMICCIAGNGGGLVGVWRRLYNSSSARIEVGGVANGKVAMSHADSWGGERY